MKYKRLGSTLSEWIEDLYCVQAKLRKGVLVRWECEKLGKCSQELKSKLKELFLEDKLSESENDNLNSPHPHPTGLCE